MRHSEDAGLVVLQAMSSERFLTINHKGELTTTVSISTFIHTYEDRGTVILVWTFVYFVKMKVVM